MIFASCAFRRTLYISLLVHLAFFSVFSFSFGRHQAHPDYPAVNFLGSFLGPINISGRLNASGKVINLETQPSFLPQAEQQGMVSFSYYQKPHVSLSASAEKVFSAPTGLTFTGTPGRRGSVITLYPPMPYHFLLYFKDRQKAHIELMYQAVLGTKSNSLLLKRRVSSGNLEVDLLSMRYMSHYLFTQSAYASGNGWQTVRIDLEPRKEQQ